MTLQINGTTDEGTTAEQTCKYVVPLVKVGTPVTPLDTQRCTLPSSFTRVVDVLVLVVGTLGTAEFIGITDMSYVLHKYC